MAVSWRCFAVALTIRTIRISTQTLRPGCCMYLCFFKVDYCSCSSRCLFSSLFCSGAVKISQTLKEGIPCLVHCSDGWDRCFRLSAWLANFFSNKFFLIRTPQLCCLVMICNSPRYRTMSGFAALIEGQWISFGHQFALRQGSCHLVVILVVFDMHRMVFSRKRF